MNQEIWFAVMLISTYPLAFLSLYIWPWDSGLHDGRDTRYRHLYNGITGLFIGYCGYGTSGLINFVATVVYSYALLYWLSTAKVNGGYVLNIPFVLLIIVMIHLSAWYPCSPSTLIDVQCSHIYRQVWNSMNSIDLSGPMMVLAVKKHNDKLTKEQRFYAINELPSFVEYAGYMFYFATFLTGPSMEYRDYEEWTRRHVHSRSNTSKDNVNISLSIGDTLVPALTRLIAGFLWAFVHLLLSLYFPVSFVETNTFHNNHSYLYMLFYLYFMLMHTRAKFYFVWLVAEGACIAMGYGIHKTTKQHAELEIFPQLTILHRPDIYLATDGMSNIRIRHVEFSSSFGMVYRNWNVKTHHWLKQYVYFRAMNSSSKLLSNHAALWTYVTSAFWHGFYPGYYLMFVTGAFMTIAERVLRKQTITLQIPSILTRVWSTAMLNYICVPFVTLGLWNSLQVYKSLYFFGHFWILFVLTLTFKPINKNK